MGPHKATSRISWAVAWADTEVPALFLGSFMGRHGGTGNLSWPVSWAYTESPASFFEELDGPTQSKQQNFLGSDEHG